MKVSVIGAGTMGSGIAQIAATKGHKVCLYDSFDGAIENAQEKLDKILNRLVEKERISKQEKENILSRINFTKDIKANDRFPVLFAEAVFVGPLETIGSSAQLFERHGVDDVPLI